MGTEVLRPHDFLVERIRLPQATVFPRRRNGYNGRTKKKASEPSIAKPITILKRGEKLDPNPKARFGNDLVASGTERIGPDPVVVMKQVRVKDLNPNPKPVLYAGSAFSVSPAPETLPLPSFFRRKEASVVVDDSATRDLRRLLRLD